ncbi:MAG: tetratricopeptide repeat protein, partial [Paracoccaceae bacterium]
AESLRYARYLSNLEKFSTAESVLVEALRLVPGNVSVLVALGGIYVATEDWPRAEQVIATLGRLGTPLASEQGAQLNLRFLQAQQRFADVGVFLGDLVAGGSNAFGAKMAIVRNYLSENDNGAARSYVAELLTDTPDDFRVQFLDAAIDAADGDFGTAEAKYRAILALNDQIPQVWVALFQAQTVGGKPDAAAATIDKALEVFPDLPTLKWIKAGVLEKSGDVDGAIAIYEVMYAQNSNNLVVANNLASLLSTSREDAETIDRANTIARRLRSSNVAQFQDTYGWIAYLRGDYEEALRSLKPAAAVMDTDPLVQYHLALAYLASDLKSEAIDAFRRVGALTGAGDSRDFVELSRTEVVRLLAEP